MTKKTYCEKTGNIRKLDLRINDMTIYVPCVFEMFSHNMALVIKDHIWFAFLIVQTVQ